MVNGRTLEEEKKRIDEFFDNMTDEEFDKMLIECGINNCPYKDEIKIYGGKNMEIKLRKCTWEESNGKHTIQKFGYFHQFGLNCSSDAEGHGVQWTVAVVEDTEGNIVLSEPYGLQFLQDNFKNDEFIRHERDFGF